MLEMLDAEPAREALEATVGARNPHLVVALLAEAARELVTHADGSGVSRRRVLLRLHDLRRTVSALADDCGEPTNVQILDQLVQLGDLLQGGDLLFPASVRLIRTPQEDALLLVGSCGTSTLPREVRRATNACGIGRLIAGREAESLEAPRESVESWLGTLALEAPLEWLAKLERELPGKSEAMTFEPADVEVLTRQTGSSVCAWRPLERPLPSGSLAVRSNRGTALIRLSPKAPTYVAVLEDPDELLTRAVRAVKLTRDDGRRLHLALRLEHELPRRVHWDRGAMTADGLVPLRIAWSEVPSAEAKIRSLGSAVTVKEKARTAFDERLIPLVSMVFSRIGFAMEDGRGS